MSAIDLSGAGPLAVINRLVDALNAHDLEALVGAFSEDYLNETPAHPLRGFTGRGQVRANWTALFAGVPDLRCAVLGAVVDGPRVWAELQMTGTRRDGGVHEMAGVTIFTVQGSEIVSARFYLEPAERTSGGVDEAIRRHMAGAPQP